MVGFYTAVSLTVSVFEVEPRPEFDVAVDEGHVVAVIMVNRNIVHPRPRWHGIGNPGANEPAAGVRFLNPDHLLVGMGN